MHMISSQHGLISTDIYKPIDKQNLICRYSYDTTDSITISIDIYIKGGRIYKRNNNVKIISLINDKGGIDNLINLINRVRHVNAKSFYYIDELNPDYEHILKVIARDMVISKIID